MYLTSTTILSIILISVFLIFWKKERRRRFLTFLKMKSLVHYNIWCSTLLILHYKLRKIF